MSPPHADSIARTGVAQSTTATLLSVALLDSAETQDELTPDSAWWLRVPAVLLSPKPVFFALREEDPDDVAARSEPV